jgi:hypothetical protein
VDVALNVSHNNHICPTNHSGITVHFIPNLHLRTAGTRITNHPITVYERDTEGDGALART